ncbi:hypothetical protein SEA_KNOCKER_61 [Mycobacterium phage Knocker]|nr:hypothetical protein SEA_KNOCKER_61 [Mycobacterium phage Knocker]
MTQPTDLDTTAGRIAFLRSTTTTRVEREADGDTSVHVTHTARFAAPEGVVPDQTHRYGSQTFAPRFITGTWTDGKLSEVRITGPRRLKSGKAAESGERNRDANSREQEYRGAMLDPDADMTKYRSTWDVPLPSVVAERLASYENDVATLTGGRK